MSDDERFQANIEAIARAKTPRARLLKIAEIPALKAEAEALLGVYPEFKHYAPVPKHEDLEWDMLHAISVLEQRAARWREYLKDKPLFDREARRIQNLPRADGRHELWRKLADEIRESKPYLKTKTDIARAVRNRLTASLDDEERAAIASIDTIRKRI